MKTTTALLAFILTCPVFASTLSLTQTRDIAQAALASYNSMAKLHGLSEERLFEGYSVISSEHCQQKGTKMTCAFDVVESDMADDDVYTPNTLHVEMDTNSASLNISLEIGC